MRGHWESQTRKLNRHYQSASNDKTWNRIGLLIPLDCVYAPFYGVFRTDNGMPLFKTDITGLSFSQSVDPKIEIAKIDVDVRPYIPRISDDYYYWDSEWGSQQPLQFVAGENGCKIRFYDYFDENLQHFTYKDIMTIPAGTDFGQCKFDLIKPEYDFYVVRGLKTDVGGQYDLGTVYESISTGTVKYDIKVRQRNVFTGGYGSTTYGFGFDLGLFGDSVRGDVYYNNSGLHMFPFIMESYSFDYFDYTKFFTGGTPPLCYNYGYPTPADGYGLSGLQCPEIWHTGPITSDASDYFRYRMPGFIYEHSGGASGTTYMTPIPMAPDNYMYATLWVLKRLTKINSTIMG